VTIPKNKNGNGEVDCTAKLQHQFKNGSETAIHKLSLNIDKENFLTADINSICIWNLAKSKRTTAFKIFENGPKTGMINAPAITSASFN